MTEDEKVHSERLLTTVIDDKKEKLDMVVQPTIEKITARQEAYQRIVEMTKQDMETYLRAHPERATDQRSKDAEVASINGIKKILEILDEYDISFAATAVPPGGENNVKDPR